MKQTTSRLVHQCVWESQQPFIMSSENAYTAHTRVYPESLTRAASNVYTCVVCVCVCAGVAISGHL